MTDRMTAVVRQIIADNRRLRAAGGHWTLFQRKVALWQRRGIDPDDIAAQDEAWDDHVDAGNTIPYSDADYERS